MNDTRIWLYQLSDLPVALVSEIPPESPLWAYLFYVGTKNNPALGKTFQMLNEDELRPEVLQAGNNVIDHVQWLLENATNGFIEGFESHPIHQQLSGSQLTRGFFAGAASLFQQTCWQTGRMSATQRANSLRTCCALTSRRRSSLRKAQWAAVMSLAS